MSKKILFLIISLSLVFNIQIFVDVNAQQGSRDIMDEYCKSNWQRDPVQCADYIPKDYDEKKAECSAQEAERARQEAQQIIKSAQESQNVCPEGSHITQDNQGNQICIDSTGRFTGYPNTGNNPNGISTTADNNLIVVVVIIFILIIIVIAVASRKKSQSTETQDYRDVKRKDFSWQTKEMVKMKQLGTCKKCGRIPTHWNFDHIHGRGDNSISNCQGLCLDCHEGKTLNDNRGH